MLFSVTELHVRLVSKPFGRIGSVASLRHKLSCPCSALPCCSSARKKESDLAAAVSRASALEGQLNKSEAALSTALSQNAALTSELADVNSLLAKVCTAFSVERVCACLFFLFLFFL